MRCSHLVAFSNSPLRTSLFSAQAFLYAKENGRGKAQKRGNIAYYLTIEADFFPETLDFFKIMLYNVYRRIVYTRNGENKWGRCYGKIYTQRKMEN